MATAAELGYKPPSGAYGDPNAYVNAISGAIKDWGAQFTKNLPNGIGSNVNVFDPTPKAPEMAAPGTTFSSELAKWNAKDPTIDPFWAQKFLYLNDTFKEGQFAPGKGTIDLANSQYAQKAKDAAPSGWDKAMDVATNVVGGLMLATVGGEVLAASGGFGAALPSSVAPTVDAAKVATTTGTTAASTSLETALTNAGIGAAKNAAIQLALTGNVDPKGLIGAGLGAGVASYIPPTIADSTTLSAAAKGATEGGVRAAVTGGDVVKGAATGAAGRAIGAATKPFLEDTFKDLATSGFENTVVGGFGGVLTGITSAAINGTDVGKGALGGLVSGVVGGGLKDAGLVSDTATGNTLAGIIGNVAGTAATKTDTSSVAAPGSGGGTTTTSAPTTVQGLSGFSSVIPPAYINLSLNRDLTNVLPQGH